MLNGLITTVYINKANVVSTNKQQNTRQNILFKQKCKNKTDANCLFLLFYQNKKYGCCLFLLFILH